MKSKFAHVLDLVRANGGFPGLGYKRAAGEANAERTMMRFALKAFRNLFLARAIDKGTITDPRVVQVFQKMPPLAIDIVCDLESRLGRHMSRSRAERLVAAYLKVTGKAAAPAIRVARQAPAAKPAPRPRAFPLPRLPAFF